MEITFYPYDFEYKVEEDKIFVYLYSVDSKGKKIIVKHEHEVFFYASQKTTKKDVFIKNVSTLEVKTKGPTAKVLKIEEVERELVGIKQKFFKVYANFPKAVPALAKEIESWGITCYERDILFIHRYLRDNGITPMTLIKAKGKKGYDINGVPVFLADVVKQEDENPNTKWNVLAIDIETYAKKKEIDAKKNPILMVGFYGLIKGKPFEKVITWKKFNKKKLDYVEFVKDEKTMLESIKEVIKEVNPEILTGYFTDGFDFPYIEERAKKHKVTLDISLDKSNLYIRKGMGARRSNAMIRGRLHVDVFAFVRNIFGKNLKTDTMSLNAVAGELLNHKKTDVDLNDLARMWDEEPEGLAQFCEYNLHDSRLTHKLCMKLLPDMIEFAQLTGLPVYDVIRMGFSRVVESYIMKKAIRKDIIAPNKPSGDQIEERMARHAKGGFVFEPMPGLYKDVVVFDFRSLYPTIITAHNIGPESFKCECCKKNTVPDRKTWWFCTKKKSFTSTVLEDLILLRSKVKKEIKKASPKEKAILEAKSYALKIMANSFYGYLGFYGARWYCFECAGSTTAYARNYIKTTIDDAKEEGFTTIYADTDSCFLVLGKQKLKDALNFMKGVNKDLPGHMELEFEGHFPRGIFVAQKGSSKGAKKKYALINDDKKLKITGFEAVRRNWSALAKEVQVHVLELVLQDKVEEALDYVKTMVRDLKSGKIPLDKLIIKTQLTRDLSKYKAIGPHVLVARRMAEKGETVGAGSLIKYVITKGKGLIRERAMEPAPIWEGQYDSDYYLNNQVIPAISSIFLVLGYKEDELFEEESQKGLGSFM